MKSRHQGISSCFSQTKQTRTAENSTVKSFLLEKFHLCVVLDGLWSCSHTRCVWGHIKLWQNYESFYFFIFTAKLTWYHVCSGSSTIVRIFTVRNRTFQGVSDILSPYKAEGEDLILGIMSLKVLTKIAQTYVCMCGLPCHIHFSQQLQDSKVSAAANWCNYPPARIDDAAV